MQVSEAQRRALFERLREQLDEGTATSVEEVTVPANVDLATREDVYELRAEMLLRFVGLEQRFGGLELRFDGLGQRFGVLEQRVMSPRSPSGAPVITGHRRSVGTRLHVAEEVVLVRLRSEPVTDACLLGAEHAEHAEHVGLDA